MAHFPPIRPTPLSWWRILPALLVGAALGLTPFAVSEAAVEEIIVRNFQFDPADVIIQQGDTVRWIWESGAHTATNGTDPGAVGAGTLFDGNLDSGNPQYEAVINDLGLIPFHCEPHWFTGMTGTITVEPAGPGAAVHQVMVREFEFDPFRVDISPGDTVRWIWQNGSHTTTSGIGSTAGLNAGALWDEAIDVGNQVFDRVFDTAGVFGYFCRPHEALDMRGAVVVGSTSGVPGGGLEPRGVEFQPPFPNPTGGLSTLVFRLPEAAAVTLEVFDLSGRRIATLLDESRPAGYNVVRWNGKNTRGHAVGSGIFFVRLRAADATEVQKIFRAEVPNHGH